MADFSSRSDTLRTNERTKHIVGVMTSLGSALVIAAFTRMGLRVSLDLYSLAWLIVAAMIIWASSIALNILEAEDTDSD
jgi:hypothetical protein